MNERMRWTMRRFQVYMLLIELHGHHFWIASSEVRGEKSDPNVAKEFDRLRWRIADELRKLDKLPQMEEILRVMFSLGFETETQRAEELKRIIGTLGEEVNPRYARIMRKINEENQRLMMRDMD